MRRIFQDNLHGLSEDCRTSNSSSATRWAVRYNEKPGCSFSSALEQLISHSNQDPAPYEMLSSNFLSAFNVGQSALARQLLTQFPGPVINAPNGAVTDVIQIAEPTVVDRLIGLERGDYATKSGRDHIMARFAIQRLTEPDFIWSPYPQFISPLHDKTEGIAGNWTHTWGPRVTSELKFDFAADNLNRDRAHSNIPTLVTNADPTTGLSITLPGSPAFYAYTNRNKTTEIIYSTVFTQHIITVGGGLLFRFNFGFLTAGRDGEYIFGNSFTFAQGEPENLYVTVDRLSTTPTQPGFDRNYYYPQGYFFVQDSYRLSSRLTLNLGFRYDNFGGPENTGVQKDALLELGQGNGNFTAALAGLTLVQPTSGNQTVFGADNKDFAPRFGISWYPVREKQNHPARRLRHLLRQAVRQPVAKRAQQRPFAGALQRSREPIVQLSGADVVCAAAVRESDARRAGRVQLSGHYAGGSEAAQRLQPGCVRGRRAVHHPEPDDPDQRHDGAGTAVDHKRHCEPRVHIGDYADDTGERFVPRCLLEIVAGQFRLRGAEHHREVPVPHAVSAGHLHVEPRDRRSERSAGGRLLRSGLHERGYKRRQRHHRAGIVYDAVQQNGDRGNSDFDQRQNLFLVGLWRSEGRRFLTKGWQISSLVAFRGGFPYSVFAPQQNYAFGTAVLEGQRADVVQPGAAMLSTPTQGPGGVYVLNPAAFATPQGVTVGNTGRNEFRGPGLYNIDLSLARAFSVPKLREGARITIRADAFNILNHANLNNPDNTITDPAFGLETYGRQGTASGFPGVSPVNETARQIQMLLRLEF